MALTLNASVECKEIAKQVRVRFAGSNDVVQHIVPLKEKKIVNKSISKSVDPKKSKRVNYAKNLSDEDDEDIEQSEDVCSAVDETEQTKNWKPSKALLVGGEEVAGSNLFHFRTPKKTGQMLNKASESVTPKSAQLKASQRSTPSRSSSKQPMTPSSSKKPPKAALQKTPIHKGRAPEVGTPQGGQRKSLRLAATTPYRLWKRNDEVESSSSDSCPSSDDDESEDRESSIASVATPFSTPTASSASISSCNKTPVSASGKRANATALMSSVKSESKKPKRKLFEQNTVAAENIESYFEAQSATVLTSDRTLSRLEMPSLDPVEMLEALKKDEFKYETERKDLTSRYSALFNKWMYLLCHGYNLLLHGFGSKYNLMEEFRKSVLKDFTHVVVNGYFPSLSIKSILSSITEDVIQHSGTFSNIVDQYEFIRRYFEQEEQDFFLLVHSIDGPMLRSEKSQVVLSLLSQVRGFHLIASIDHINAPLLWDQAKISRFRWLWQDVTTFENYTNETSYENSLMIQQTGGLAMSSLIHVMRSLTPNARGIFMLLAKYQLDNKDNNTYQGLAFPDLYQKCRETFLVNSELTLRTQLTEFKDHKLIRIKKGFDGVDHLIISLDASTLAQYMEGENEQR